MWWINTHFYFIWSYELCWEVVSKINKQVNYILKCFIIQGYTAGKYWLVIAQLCPTLCNTMDCSLPGSSILEIFQAGILEWAVISPL